MIKFFTPTKLLLLVAMAVTVAAGFILVPQGTTLGKLVETAASAGVPLREALDHSPHLTDTMMLNGERCPFGDNTERVLADGDEIYLLAPLAGG